MCLAFLWAPEHDLGSFKRGRTLLFLCLVSKVGGWVEKHSLASFEAPKLRALKFQTCPQICLFKIFFLFLFNLICFISLFCRVLSKHGVHLKRYFWLSLFHIFFSNYASYFLFRLILSCMFFQFWKVLSLLNKGCWFKNLCELFSLFITFHDIVVLQCFCILQVHFVPTCAHVQSFDS